MCFSAIASFAASAVLLPAGIYCLRHAFRKNRAYLPLAIIPCVFSLHQLLEGLVWHGIEAHDQRLTQQASVAYLFIAVALWPFWIPFSIFCAETRRTMQVALGILAIIGLAWTWLYLPILQDPDRWLVTEVMHHSMRYDYRGLPGFELVPPAAWRIGYLLMIAVPLVLATTRNRLSPLGGAISLGISTAVVASFVVSYYVFWYAFTSVWCFFAAFLALCLCYVFYRLPARSNVALPSLTHAQATPAGL